MRLQVGYSKREDLLQNITSQKGKAVVTRQNFFRFSRVSRQVLWSFHLSSRLKLGWIFPQRQSTYNAQLQRPIFTEESIVKKTPQFYLMIKTLHFLTFVYKIGQMEIEKVKKAGVPDLISRYAPKKNEVKLVDLYAFHIRKCLFLGFPAVLGEKLPFLSEDVTTCS